MYLLQLSVEGFFMRVLSVSGFGISDEGLLTGLVKDRHGNTVIDLKQLELNNISLIDEGWLNAASDLGGLEFYLKHMAQLRHDDQLFELEDALLQWVRPLNRSRIIVQAAPGDTHSAENDLRSMVIAALESAVAQIRAGTVGKVLFDPYCVSEMIVDQRGQRLGTIAVQDVVDPVPQDNEYRFCAWAVPSGAAAHKNPVEYFASYVDQVRRVVERLGVSQSDQIYNNSDVLISLSRTA